MGEPYSPVKKKKKMEKMDMACLNVSPYRSRHLNHEEWTSSLTIRCPHQTHTVSRPWKSDGRHCNNFQYKTTIVAAICFDTARFCLSEQVARGKKKNGGKARGIFHACRLAPVCLLSCPSFANRSHASRPPCSRPCSC